MILKKISRVSGLVEPETENLRNKIDRSSMQPEYASSRNITTLERLLMDDELRVPALCFLNAFLPFEVLHFEADALYTLRLFHAAGTFHDDIIVKIEDKSGGLHFVEIALLHMRPGNTSGYLKADQDFHYKFREKEGTHYAGRDVHCLYFMQFETDTHSGYHIEKRYTINTAPYSVHFDCFELPEFHAQAPELSTDRNRWLYWLTHDRIPPGWEETLLPLTDWKHWNSEWQESYHRHIAWSVERFERDINESKNPDPRYFKEPAGRVTWNWHFLEKQIGILPKRKVKPEEINLSAIAGQIPACAFQLFRKWSANCKARYPDLHIILESEHLLPVDLKEALGEAVVEVFNYEKYYLYSCNSERGGAYLEGYLHAILNRHWYLEYVIKQKDDFKTCMMLRCLSLWIKLEEVQSLKIDDLYDQIMRSKVNLADWDTSIAKIDLKDQEDRLVERNEGASKVHIVIENLLHQYINKISALETEDFMPEISEVIDEKVLVRLMEHNKSFFL